MTHEISPHAPIGSTGGWVALVGGGPGSSGLITARGLELLGQADVVVVDALAPRDLLEGRAAMSGRRRRPVRRDRPRGHRHRRRRHPEPVLG